MAEWGKYLKNAVANVEQQLDKVLLENQGSDVKASSLKPTNSATSTAPKSVGRPDLAERLRQAANGQPKKGDNGELSHSRSVSASQAANDSSRASLDASETGPRDTLEEKPPQQAEAVPVAAAEGNSLEANNTEDLSALTCVNFVTPPDVGNVLTKARQLALAVHRDDALTLVDELENITADLGSYVDNVYERLTSMNAKIATLSRDKIDNSTDAEKKIALLMEEGYRLSKRELDLNMVIKKLRNDRTAALAKSEQVATKNEEIEKLKRIVDDQKNKIKDSEALIEHFRSIAETSESTLRTRDSTPPSTKDNSPADPNTSSTDPKTEIVQRHYAEEREKWHKLEEELLSRIAELERDHDMRNNTIQQLQKRLNDTQKAAGEGRDQITVLQEELDSLRETHTSAETRFKSQINDLTTELMILQQQLKNAEKREVEHETEKVPPHSTLPVIDSDSPHQDGGPEPVPQVSSTPQLTPQQELSVSSNGVSLAVSPLMSPHEDGSSLAKDSDLSLSHLNQVAVGPAGPFGALAEDFDPDHRPIREENNDLTDDSFSFMQQSRRESSMQGSESIQGSHLHLVRKLTLSIRRLEHELSSAQKAADISRKQRDEAQAEVANLIEVQEQLQTLEDSHAKLKVAHDEVNEQLGSYLSEMTEKDERIEELEADVRDLKEMYKDQIEALITEIEAMKKH